MTPRSQAPAPTYRPKSSTRTYAPPQRTSRPRILSRSETITTPNRNRVTPQHSQNQISASSYTRKPSQPNNTPTQRRSIQPSPSPRTSTLLNRNRAIPTPSRNITPTYRNKNVTPRSQAPAPTYRPKSSTRTYAPPQRTSRPRILSRSETITTPNRNRVTPQHSQNQISASSYTRKPSQPNNTPTQRRSIQPSPSPRTSSLLNRNRAIPTPSRSITPTYRNKTVTPQYQALRPSTSGRSTSLPKTTTRRTPSRQMTTPRSQAPAPTYRPKSSTRTYAPPLQRTSRPQEVKASVPSRNRAAPPSRSRSIPSRNTSPSRARSIPQRAKSIPSR